MNYEATVRELSSSYGDWWKKGFDAPEMTSGLRPYTAMFSPVRVNSVTLKNRLVMAPMGNISMCEENGRPNAKMLKYFEERAKGGVGLITTGLVPTSFGIDSSLIERGKLSYFPRIDRSRTVLAGWRDLSAMCHSHGAAVFVQLTPGLGRVGNPQCLVDQLRFPRSSSLNPSWYMKEVPCLPLTDLELDLIIKKTGQAAADGKACDIDGVYLHGHEGYLLEQMTNPAFNRRLIGKYAKYEAFGIELVREIRRRVGPKYPIMYRIDLTLALNATYGRRMRSVSPLNKFSNERTCQQTLTYMRHLVDAGVDMFDVDIGCYDNWWLPHPPSSMPSGCYLDIAEIAKKYFADHGIKSNAGFPVPVVAVGKLGYPDLAEKALRDGKCDLVMLGRPLLADPELPNKAFSGRVSEIRPCIGCQEGCLNEFVKGGHPQCAVNPRTAFEEEFPAEIPKAPVKKKVAVIGAGPAGITACEVLIARGHKVDLYEKRDRVGGEVIPGSAAKIKYEMKNYLTYLEGVVARLKKSRDFKLITGTEATAEMLKDKGYDAIITASGARQCRPAADGAESPDHLFATDVLEHPELLDKAEDIVIVGGGTVGCETAYMLAYEYGKRVSVVEMGRFMMNGSCTANRGHLIHYLEKADVELINCARVTKINPGSVEITVNIGTGTPDPYNTWSPVLPENVENPLEKLRPVLDEYENRELRADRVVFAAGVRPDSELYYDCVRAEAAPEIYNIGDSFIGGNVHTAVRSAYRKALTV